MPVSDTLADPVAEPNTWKATVLDPWVDDVSDAIAALEAGGGSSGIIVDLYAAGVRAGLTSNSSLATANAGYIQAAEDAANTAGGGVLIFPPGTIPCAPLVKKSYVHWRGSGRYATVLALRNGANADFVVSYNFASLTGTTQPTAAGGIEGFSISHMTITGNRTQQTGTSSGLKIYGRSYLLFDLTIRECLTNCLYSEYQPVDATATWGGTESMVAHVMGCLFSQSGNTTVAWNGPHDSFFTSVEIRLPDTNYGLHVQAKGAGTHFTNVHAWGDQAGSPSICRIDAASQHSSVQYEGGETAVVDVQADYVEFYGKVYWPSAKTVHAFKIGTAATTFPSRCRIFAWVRNCNSGAFNFVADGGQNWYEVIGEQTTGPAYSGSGLNYQNKLRIDITGVTSGQAQEVITGAPIVRVGADSAQSLTADGQTVNTAGLGSRVVTPTASRTGIILQAGTSLGQRFRLLNVNTGSFTVTLSASTVVDGTSIVIPANRAQDFEHWWDGWVAIMS